jgi:hypothetical protein
MTFFLFLCFEFCIGKKRQDRVTGQQLSLEDLKLRLRPAYRDAQREKELIEKELARMELSENLSSVKEVVCHFYSPDVA